MTVAGRTPTDGAVTTLGAAGDVAARPRAISRARPKRSLLAPQPRNDAITSAAPGSPGGIGYAPLLSFPDCRSELIPDPFECTIGPQVVYEMDVWAAFKVVHVSPYIPIVEVEELPIGMVP